MNDVRKTKKQLVAELEMVREEIESLQMTDTQIRHNYPDSVLNADLIHKQAEEDGLEIGSYLDQMFLNMHAGLAILGVPDYRYLQINHVLAEINGLSREAHLGKPLAEVLPEAAADILPRLDEIVKTGIPSPPREFSTQLPKNPQEARHFIDTFHPILGKDGKVAAVGAVVIEITNRVQAEREIQDIAKFPAENPNPVLRMSEDGLILYANEASESLLIDWSIVLGALLPKEVLEKYHTAAKNGSDQISFDIETGGRTFHLTFAPFRESNYVNIYFHDITEKNRVDAQNRIQLQQLSALREIDNAINSNLDIGLTFEILLRQAIEQLGIDAATVLVTDQHMKTLDVRSQMGFQSGPLRQPSRRLGDGFASAAALEKRTVSIPNLEEAAIDGEDVQFFLQHGFVSYYGVPIIVKGTCLGVLEIFNRSPLTPDVEWREFLEVLSGKAAIAIENYQLFNDLQHTSLELTIAYDATLEGWANALELFDVETVGHSRRVTELSSELAQELGMRDEELVHVRRGALLHDIGKMGIDRAILNKPGPLDEQEWEQVRKHPTISFELLSGIKYLRPALSIPYSHHEKWDGTGYPKALKGEQIPIEARIFSVVDVWDALTSERPYSEAWSKKKALKYIQDQAGAHFDADVVKVFIRLITARDE